MSIPVRAKRVGRAGRVQYQRTLKLDMLRAWCYACSLVCLVQCSPAPREGTAQLELTELRYLGSFGSVNYAELAEDLGYLAPLRLKWMGNVLGGPESIQAVSTRDIDFGGAATGSVIKLIAAGAPIRQVMASNGVDDLTWGGYFVLEDSPVQNARDLLGKTISVNTMGAHAEFMIREYLRRGGLTKQQVKQVTMVITPPINGEQSLRLRHVDVASLSGVLRDRALQRGGLRLLFTDRDLFGNFNSSTTVFRTDFLAQRPNTVRAYVAATARAIEWARATPRDTVRARLKQILAKRKRGEDPALAEHWHSVGIRSTGGLLSDADMRLWVSWLDREGDLFATKLHKLSDLYTNEFNPYREAPESASYRGLSRHESLSAQP
jgi:ABC-type nitrate/sulfonate/bicarbonate transport system substrate-binding protein